MQWTHPQWAWLLVPAVPLLVWYHLRTLSDFPPRQRAASLVIRLLVTILLVAALCGPVVLRSTDKQMLIFAIDHSESIDEAARSKADEFVAAFVGNDRYIVDSSSLLGICFLEKGLPELAVRSYRKGLESPSISEEATLGLLYDMGNAYMSLGDSAAAYKTFVEVYGLNSHYRDTAARLEDLKAKLGSAG